MLAIGPVFQFDSWAYSDPQCSYYLQCFPYCFQPFVPSVSQPALSLVFPSLYPAFVSPCTPTCILSSFTSMFLFVSHFVSCFPISACFPYEFQATSVSAPVHPQCIFVFSCYFVYVLPCESSASAHKSEDCNLQPIACSVTSPPLVTLVTQIFYTTTK